MNNNNIYNNNDNNSFNSIKLNDDIKYNNLKNFFDENENDDINSAYKHRSIENESYLGRSIFNEKRFLKKRRELPIITESNGNKNILNEYVDINKIGKINFRIVKDKKWSNNLVNSVPQNKFKNKLFNSKNILQNESNKNIFRKSNLNNRFKESGINIINNIRINDKKNNIKLYENQFEA